MLTGAAAATGMTVHLSTVLIGLHWLYDTAQPEDAVALFDDQEQAVTSAGGWRFTFIPSGPAGTPKIVVDTRSPRHRVSQNDLAELVGHIEDFGETVRRAYLSGALGILELDRAAHPSLLSAMARSSQHGTAPAVSYSRAVGIAELQQQTLNSTAALSALTGLSLLWPIPLRDPRAAAARRRSSSSAARARTSKAPPSLRRRCRDERLSN